MKTKEFMSELRMIIREEVSYAVRQELKKVLTESTHTSKPQETIITPKVVSKPAPAKKKFNFKDPVLAELLESTSPMRQEHGTGVDFEEWPTMNYGNGTGHIGYKTAGPINATPNGMNFKAIEEAAPEVAAALTRDYRDLVKAMDKKKGR